MWVKILLRPLYRQLLRSKRLQGYTWKLTYSNKFVEWLSQHPCKEQFSGSWEEARRALWEFIIITNGFEGAIDYLEFGVQKGASIRWWTERNKHPDSCFVGFYSFEGLPAFWTADRPKGTFTTHRKTPEIPDNRCSFRVGLFQNTLPTFFDEFPLDKPLVVHLDADLYSSTLFVLCTLAPRLMKGSILIFNEFSDPHHEFRAFMDFVAAHNVDYELLGSTSRFLQLTLCIV